MDLSFSTDQPVSPVKNFSLEMSELQCSLLHDVNCISSIIMAAKEQELKNETLVKLLSQSLLHLHPSIQLPENGAVESLSQFVFAYIDSVPHFFEAIINTAFESGLDKILIPPLKVAIDFLMTQSSLSPDCSEMEALLDASFFAHRLFEEINDYYQVKAGIAIVYVDMTTANLMVHNIIGDEFANKLDQAVTNATQKILAEDTLFESDAFQQHLSEKDQLWDSIWQHWSDLFSVKGIHLNLNNGADK